MVAIVDPESLPIKALVAKAKSEGKLLDFTGPLKTMSIIITDQGVLIRSPIKAGILVKRIDKLNIME